MSYKYKKEGKGMYIFLGITALACFLLASSVFPFFFSSQGKPVPDIMLCFVCGLTAFTDIKKSSIYALGLGLAADLFVNPPTALSPIIFLGCMCLADFIRRYFSRVGTLVIAVSIIPCSLVKYLVSGVVSSLTVEGEGVFLSVLSRVPVGILADFACAIALAFIMRVLSKKMRLSINN